MSHIAQEAGGRRWTAGWHEAPSRTATLEAAIAETLGARDAVAVASPMAAVQLAYRATDRPLGTTVLATSLADPAVVRAAVASGYRLAFVDVDARGHLAPRALAAHVALHGTPGLVVASHYAGHPCDVAALAAAAPGALVLEDAIEALGAVGADGAPVGAPRHSVFAIVGLHPVRSAAPAQGAVLLTDDAALAAACRRARDEHAELRLSEVHAALALVELGRLPRLVAERTDVAIRYEAALAMHRLITPVGPMPGARSAWTTFPVRVPAWLRADMHARLRALGVGPQRVALLLHRHPFFGRYADVLPAELPATERFAAETLMLPTSAAPGVVDPRRVATALDAMAAADAGDVALAG